MWHGLRGLWHARVGGVGIRNHGVKFPKQHGLSGAKRSELDVVAAPKLICSICTPHIVVAAINTRD